MIHTLSGDEMEGTWRDDPTLCPACGRKSWNVPQAVTLIFHVLETYWRQVKPLTDRHRKGFRFCPHRECEVVYFHAEAGLVVTTAEVRTRVGYKVRGEPIPVCYCVGVPASVIREEILVKQCCDSLEDIQRMTGARTGKWCHITNPSGRCCGPLVNRVIEEALAERKALGVSARAREIAADLMDKSTEAEESGPPSDSCCLVPAPEN